jgi:hypothetical protein
MKRGSLILLVLFVGCDAHFESGKTHCSNKGECPSGYVCNAASLCIAVSGGGGGMGAAGRTGGPGGIGGIAGAGGSLGGAGSSGTTSIPGCPTPKAGGTCNVFPASCGCPAGQVCHAASESIGLGCTADSGLGDGADCSGAKVCASGFGCFEGICSKYCEYDSDCPEVDMTQGCLPLTWGASGNDILGVSVCAEICDPVSPQYPMVPLVACPAGFGCSANSWGDSYCQKQAGIGVTDSYCLDDTYCMPGYFCDISSDTCTKYCFVYGNDCPLGTTCNSFSSSNWAGYSSEVGYCYY